MGQQIDTIMEFHLHMNLPGSFFFFPSSSSCSSSPFSHPLTSAADLMQSLCRTFTPNIHSTWLLWQSRSFLPIREGHRLDLARRFRHHFCERRLYLCHALDYTHIELQYLVNPTFRLGSLSKHQRLTGTRLILISYLSELSACTH